ncbi:MAG: MBL fold metallo-hydrolase [Chloroflexota bacterium]|nr:MBL fold metallo-hydrolase [Chloroflexota bacterium]
MPFDSLVPGVGGEIIADVDGFTPPSGIVAVWFLGQAGFIIKFSSGTVCYLDPWLSDLSGGPRAYPIPLDPTLVTNCDILLTSHDHGDHIDVDADPIIMRQSPQAMWIAPRGAEPFVRRLGGAEERTHLLNGDDAVTVRDVRITAIPSTHYGFFDEERYTPTEEAWYATIPAQLPPERRGQERFIGFVLECDGVTIYHAGDNNGYHGFLERLARWTRFDLMMLPINGRDWFREQHRVIGNFTYREAAQVAQRANARLLVPYHYDGFTGNNEYPDALVRYVQNDGPPVPVRVLQVGERALVERGAGL